MTIRRASLPAVIGVGAVAVSIALNMLAGPLNWFGLDPHVGQCKVPEVPPPSNSMPSIVSVH